MTRARLVICAAGLALLPGCSLWVGRAQDLTIRASDPAARIYVDDLEAGVGEVTLTVRRDSPHVVVARVDNRATSAIVGVGLSTTAVIDIILAFPTFGLTAIFGNMAPGFWVLDQDEVYLAVPR